MVRAPAQCRFYDLGECSIDSWLERYGVKAASNDPLSRTARIYGNLPMISPEVKSFDSFVARMGEGKGQILTSAHLLAKLLSQ
jgi:hypothetical protein